MSEATSIEQLRESRRIRGRCMECGASHAGAIKSNPTPGGRVVLKCSNCGELAVYVIARPRQPAGPKPRRLFPSLTRDASRR